MDCHLGYFGRHTLREIDGLMNARPDTPEGDRLDVLVTSVEAWKPSIIRSTCPDAVEAIK